jgi:biotin transport system substrate-specific component
VLAGTGLVAAAAQISVKLPFTPVPITGQTFAVVLVGASLGAVRGAASLSLYFLFGIIGAPIYAHHESRHQSGEDARVRPVPFVPGDIFKLYLAALALPLAWRGARRWAPLLAAA